MVIGGVMCRNTGKLNISKEMRNRPKFTQLLVCFAKKIVPEGFRFTSIQVNKNCSSRVHCDCNNRGQSCIVGLGNYSGGKLWTTKVSLIIFGTQHATTSLSSFYPQIKSTCRDH